MGDKIGASVSASVGARVAQGWHMGDKIGASVSASVGARVAQW